MNIYDKNTKLFYNVLKYNCDPDKLLLLARKGIFLYEPLYRYNKFKNHKYVIEISILGHQFFMINNKNQFYQFLHLLPYFKNFTIYPYNNVSDLVIINKYFIEQLISETNKRKEILLYINQCNELLLEYYLFKYSKISFNVYKLFTKNHGNKLIVKTEINKNVFNYFYLNENNNLLNLINNKIVEEETFIKYMMDFYSRDIKILKYILNNIKNLKLYKCLSELRVPLTFPLDTLIKYTEKIYEPNKLYFLHKNKDIQDFVNIVFSDKGILDIDLHSKLYFQQAINRDLYIHYGMKYTIREKDYKIVNNNTHVKNIYYIKYENRHKNKKINKKEAYKNSELEFDSDIDFDIDFDIDDELDEFDVDTCIYNKLMKKSKYINNNLDNSNYELLDIKNIMHISNNLLDKKSNLEYYKSKGYDDADRYFFEIITKEHLKFKNSCYYFGKKFLNSIEKIENIMINPEYIIEMALNQYGNKLFSNEAVRTLTKICYILSLIYNHSSFFLIKLLSKQLYHDYGIEISNKNVIFKAYHYNKIKGYYLYKNLSKTPHKYFNSIFIF